MAQGCPASESGREDKALTNPAIILIFVIALLTLFELRKLGLREVNWSSQSALSTGRL